MVTSGDHATPIERDRSETFSDVLVVPFDELLDDPWGGSRHRGGPDWPNWENQVFPRHCVAGHPTDDRPLAPDAEAAPLSAAAWGGPVVRNFGHQVADFAMRLTTTRAERPELPVLFASKRSDGWSDLGATPRSFVAILDWLGIPADDRVLIGSPIRVDELFVAEQAEQLDGPGPTELHLDRMDELVEHRLGSAHGATRPVTYVSRAGQTYGLAGETYLEGVLTRAGVHTIRPETLRLHDQLRTYRRSEQLVFSEGSAVHGLQLLGRLQPEVTILERRPEKHIAEASIAARVETLRYVVVVDDRVVGILPSGAQASPTALNLLSESLVIDAFRNFGVDLASTWDRRAFGRAREADATAWLESQAARRTMHGPESVDAIVAGLRRVGLTDLGRNADWLLREQRPPLWRGLSSSPGRRTWDQRLALPHRTVPVAGEGGTVGMDDRDTTRDMTGGPGPDDAVDRALLFMHIPKTAGTSLRASLGELFPPTERAYVYETADLDGAIDPSRFADLPRDDRAQLRLVMGHFAYGIHDQIPGPSVYVTMLRDAVDRVASLYFHYRSMSEPREGSRGTTERRLIDEQALSLDDWVFERRALETDNAMVRTITARPGVPFGTCPDDMLTEALEHIEARFAAVLIRGLMDDSLKVLEAIVGAPIPPVGRHNVNATRASVHELAPETRRRIRELNHLDAKLFGIVHERFPETVARWVR